jgi:SulP family sulfate permease
MSRISTIDATGAHVLDDVIGRLQRRGIAVLMSGIRPGHDQILATLGVADRLRREGLLFPDTPAAIRYARTHLLGRPVQGAKPAQTAKAAPAPVTAPAVEAAGAGGQLGAGPQM